MERDETGAEPQQRKGQERPRKCRSQHHRHLSSHHDDEVEPSPEDRGMQEETKRERERERGREGGREGERKRERGKGEGSGAL